MLAKDAAGQTVKVARGLHDLSEMEGVKVLLSLSLFFDNMSSFLPIYGNKRILTIFFLTSLLSR